MVHLPIPSTVPWVIYTPTMAGRRSRRLQSGARDQTPWCNQADRWREHDRNPTSSPISISIYPTHRRSFAKSEGSIAHKTMRSMVGGTIRVRDAVQQATRFHLAGGASRSPSEGLSRESARPRAGAKPPPASVSGCPRLTKCKVGYQGISTTREWNMLLCSWFGSLLPLQMPKHELEVCVLGMWMDVDGCG